VPPMPEIGRAELGEFFADQSARWRPATAAYRLRSLQQFFKWLIEEEEVSGKSEGRSSAEVPDNCAPKGRGSDGAALGSWLSRWGFALGQVASHVRAWKRSRRVA
jgi:hypothetical protein